MLKVVRVLHKPKAHSPVCNATVKVFLLIHITEVPAVECPHTGDSVSEVSQRSTVVMAVDYVAAILANHVHRHVHTAPVAVHVKHIAKTPQLAVGHMNPAKLLKVQIVWQAWNHLSQVHCVRPYPLLQPVFVIALNEDFLALQGQRSIHLVEPSPCKVAVITDSRLAARIFVKATKLIEVQQVTKADKVIRLDSLTDTDKALNSGLVFVRNMNIRTDKYGFHKCPKSEYHGHSFPRCA